MNRSADLQGDRVRQAVRLVSACDCRHGGRGRGGVIVQEGQVPFVVALALAVLAPVAPRVVRAQALRAAQPQRGAQLLDVGLRWLRLVDEQVRPGRGPCADQRGGGWAFVLPPGAALQHIHEGVQREVKQQSDIGQADEPLPGGPRRPQLSQRNRDLESSWPVKDRRACR